VLRINVTSLAAVGVLIGIALVINAVNEAALARAHGRRLEGGAPRPSASP
jgi:hypothetical protein